jgi:hypothetical protein
MGRSRVESFVRLTIRSSLEPEKKALNVSTTEVLKVAGTGMQRQVEIQKELLRIDSFGTFTLGVSSDLQAEITLHGRAERQGDSCKIEQVITSVSAVASAWDIPHIPDIFLELDLNWI